MQPKAFALTRNKTTLALLVLALVIGGISAQATGLLNLTSGVYLVCVNPKTSVVTHPSTSKCPKGFKKLVIGEQGDAGTVGLNGAAGLSGGDGKNGIDGKDGSDGKTLWSGTNDPANTLGAPGDIFINSATRVLFGPKDLITGWPAGVSILGRQGVKGEIGSQGATGATGSGGANGSNGATGSNGSNGATGANGTNGTVGTNGSYGLSCAQGGTCAIGSTGPGGGKVFYISATPNTTATPWRYMEAAPDSWSGGADPSMEWGSVSCGSAYVPALSSGSTGARNTKTAIGSGFSNTKLMLGSCTYGAANMAASYNGGGKSDWFLPSKDELNQMCKWARAVAWGSDATLCTGGTLNLGTGAGLGAAGFVANIYWSSFEYGATYAGWQDFTNGSQGSSLKATTLYVRPIRAF